MFYAFSLFDRVDDPDTLHRIYACASYGAGWFNLLHSEVNAIGSIEPMNSTYTLGWFNDGVLAATDIRSVSRQMIHYLRREHAATNNTFLFARSGSASLGLYIGKGLQDESVGSVALKYMEDQTRSLEINSGSVALQLCNPNQGGTHTLGVFASSNGTFTPVQDALLPYRFQRG